MCARRHDVGTAQKLRNVLFGVEDGIVSTLGVLSGIAIAGVPRSTIFLMGVVVIFVEAFSMGAGSYLSEHFSAEFLKKKFVTSKTSTKAAIGMFFSYFFAGFIPLFPYIILDVAIAFPVSVVISLITLFALGYWSGAMSHVSVFRSGVRMFVIGGIAIVVGLAAGLIMKALT
jgi:VIT1/CCC1 family predicted Fe2+/Mn2+ transporter